MSEFKVESGIPVQKKPYNGGGAPRKYPWTELGIGDSFFVPGKTSKQFPAAWASRRYGIKIRVRTVDGGVRVWRTA